MEVGGGGGGDGGWWWWWWGGGGGGWRLVVVVVEVGGGGGGGVEVGGGGGGGWRLVVVVGGMEIGGGGGGDGGWWWWWGGDGGCCWWWWWVGVEVGGWVAFLKPLVMTILHMDSEIQWYISLEYIKHIYWRQSSSRFYRLLVFKCCCTDLQMMVWCKFITVVGDQLIVGHLY